jgi:glycosyltransferase involved in cell wall biosynthesis
MRVLFLNYEYPPLGGGAANATSYLLQEYAKIPDLKVDLVTSGVGEKYEVERIGKNIQIYKLPIGKNEKNLHFQSQKDLLVYSWKAYFFSKRLIKKRKYDLTHSFFSVPCGFLSLIFKKRYGIPYIVSLRGADVPGYTDRFSFVYKVITPLIKIIWEKADAVISNSEGLKDLARKTNPDQKIGIIYNGVDTQNFQLDPLGFSGSSNSHVFRILCISRLTERKGIRYLIEAMKLLVPKYPLIRLKIVGEGDAKEALEEQVEKLGLREKVEFAGRIKHDKLPKIYSDSQIFVLPSLNEGMSNTMLEALASGLPIIATDTGGTKELVEDGGNGFIVNMRDGQDIAEKIESLVSDRELCSRMSKKSRKRAEGLSWKNVAERYWEAYKSSADS